VLGYVFAVFAAVANAASSVLQRRAGEGEREEREMTLRLVLDLIRKPVWLLGILAVIAGFLLQATALSYGRLAQIEPVLIIELPLTILAAWRFLGEPMGRRQTASIVAMTLGLAGLLFFLSPRGGHPGSVSMWRWGLALAAGYGVIGGLVVAGRRTAHDMARSAYYGAATGCGFGVTAALIKGMTDQLQYGFGSIFTAWQTYLMIATGAASMYLLQNAVAAGKLVAAQPGFTLADPVVAILWGTLVFDEHVRHGRYILFAVLSFGVVVVSVVALSQTEEVQQADGAGNESPHGKEEHSLSR
jgi:drug/metabolite transporter (DMT)-like permease